MDIHTHLSSILQSLNDHLNDEALILASFFTFVLGSLFTHYFLLWIRLKCGVDDYSYHRTIREIRRKIEPENTSRITEDIAPSPFLQGTIEKGVFFSAILLDVQGVLQAMAIYLGLKFYSNLNRNDLSNWIGVRYRAITGLLGALLSMYFALLGGYIANGQVQIVDAYLFSSILILVGITLYLSYLYRRYRLKNEDKPSLNLKVINMFTKKKSQDKSQSSGLKIDKTERIIPNVLESICSDLMKFAVDSFKKGEDDKAKAYRIAHYGVKKALINFNNMREKEEVA